MAQRPKALVILLTFVIGLLLAPSTARSWGPFAHYQITLEATGSDYAPYANLPDIWPSHGGYARLFEITEWFAWSHGAQRTGRTELVPNVPVYPAVRQDPGEMIYRSYLRSRRGDRVRHRTALGFLVHNVQDRQVHWDYFRGGSRAAWVEEHEYKEHWADCWIYTLRIAGTYNEQGEVSTEYPLLTEQVDIGAISQSQAEAVTQGLSVDADGQRTLSKVESTNEIRSRLAQARSTFKSYLSKVSASRCRWLKEKYARNYNWTLNQLETYYKASVAATREVLRRFRP